MVITKKKKWGKILVVDDFDRVSSEKQEEAYKLFNILNGKLPIIFVGNYSKLTKNEDNYLQKIIDRQIELPYSLHSQSIWEKYFCEIQKKFNVKVNSDLVKIFTNEKRNLREQYHFNDYVNLELIERGKSKHVQIDQQLFIIYLYLFHKNYYQKILEGWSPKQKQSEEFENEVEKNIFTILKDNSNYPESFFLNKTGYFLFENINNLSIDEAESIIDDKEELNHYLIEEGEYVNDFYKYVMSLFDNNHTDSCEEKLHEITVASFKLLEQNTYSTLVTYIPKAFFDKWQSNQNPENIPYYNIDEKDKFIISFFEKRFLQNFDLSQKLHFFINIFKYINKEEVYSKYKDDAKEILKEDNKFSIQKNKPFLLSLFVLNDNRSWIRPDQWNECTKKRIKELKEIDFIKFWFIYRIIKLEFRSDYHNINFENIEKITIVSMYNNNDEIEDNSDILELFENRLMKISEEKNILVVK